MCISPEVRAEIKSRLANVETQYGVYVLYACESGSRAWGFPSANSDYDVFDIQLEYIKRLGPN